MWKKLSDMVQDFKESDHENVVFQIDTRDLHACISAQPFNTSEERYPANEVLAVLYREVGGPDWKWYLNSKCKYVQLHVNVTEKLCTICDRKGNIITMEQLLYPHG